MQTILLFTLSLVSALVAANNEKAILWFVMFSIVTFIAGCLNFGIEKNNQDR